MRPSLALRYGSAAAQVVDLYLPDQSAGHAAPGTVLLIHGGFWDGSYDRSLEDDLVMDLVAHGYAVANLDYRGVGTGGGWPTTFQDVAAGCDALVPALTDRGLDPSRVAVVGHSAGGHLALWAAGRVNLSTDSPGAGPLLRPAAVVAQAAVTDLALAHSDNLGPRATADFLDVAVGTPVPDPLLTVTSPVRLLPLGIPTLLVTGDADDRVPHRFSQHYAERAEAAGDPVDVVIEPGTGHFEHLDPTSTIWAGTRAWVQSRLAR